MRNPQLAGLSLGMTGYFEESRTSEDTSLHTILSSAPPKRATTQLGGVLSLRNGDSLRVGLALAPSPLMNAAQNRRSPAHDR